MEISCIGTGTVVPDRERVGSAFLWRHRNLRILFDCGPGAVHHLARFAEWKDPTHLAISHFHNDHIGDLPALFFAWKHGMRPARSAPLVMIGPRGLDTFVRTLPDALGGHVRDPGFDIRIEEWDGGESWEIDAGVVLRAHRTPHTDVSLAFRIDAAEGGFGYTGDTGPSAELGAFFQDVDVLLAECSLPDDEALPTHLTPRTVAELALRARPGLLLLTHLYPQLHPDRLMEDVRHAGWHGAVRIVRDGDRFPVHPQGAPRP